MLTQNPIEVYVAARNVRSLAPGFYRYAAGGPMRRSRVGRRTARASARRAPAELTNGGTAGSLAALVLFTAVFERTRWRYNGPRAYRAVLLEAGHVCQTFCLTATWLGLAPFCSMALADAAIEKVLGLDGVSESVDLCCRRRPASSAASRRAGGHAAVPCASHKDALTMANPLVHVEQIAFRFPGALRCRASRPPGRRRYPPA